MEDEVSVKSVGNEWLVFHPLTHSLPPDLNNERVCPLSFTKGKRILRKTLAYHVFPKYWPYVTDKGYYFCNEKQCPIIYYNNKYHYYFGHEEVATVVAQKLPINTPNKPICYCKNVLEQKLLEELLIKKCCHSLIDLRQYTEANTGKDCSITNPSGRCCGKQIKEILTWAKKETLSSKNINT